MMICMRVTRCGNGIVEQGWCSWDEALTADEASAVLSNDSNWHWTAIEIGATAMTQQAPTWSEIQSGLPYGLDDADRATVTSLLRAIWRDKPLEAQKELDRHNCALGGRPRDLLAAGDLGTVRVIDYLKDCADNQPAIGR
jgi:hypothetical protein